MLRFGKWFAGVVLGVCVVLGCSAFTPTPPNFNALTLDFGNRQVVITEADLTGGWFNYDSQQQLTHGKSLFARATGLTTPADFPGYFPDLVHYLEQIAPEFEIAPYDGRVNFFPNQTPRFTVTNQQAGRVIDRERLYADLTAALKGNRFPVVPVYFREVAPREPAQIIAEITQRSEFSPHFKVNPNRESNLALALNKFNGLVISPGETVSFNQVVGARTAEQGFKEAKIIVNGEYVDGIGGGVCQVSTTLFNAVVQAGLQIVEAHHHTLPSSYVPLGTDAMVSSSADLKFTNNTGAPVYLETQLHNQQITVRVYGRDKGPQITYRLATQTIKTIAPTEAWAEDVTPAQQAAYAAHPEQYERVLASAGQPGYTVDTYLETYQGSRRLSRKRLRRATYKSTPQRYTLRRTAVPDADNTDNPDVSTPALTNFPAYFSGVRS